MGSVGGEEDLGWFPYDTGLEIVGVIMTVIFPAHQNIFFRLPTIYRRAPQAFNRQRPPP